MRSVLLFLLGGVLVWWLWSSIGGSPSVVGAEGGAPGALLPPEPKVFEEPPRASNRPAGVVVLTPATSATNTKLEETAAAPAESAPRTP